MQQNLQAFRSRFDELLDRHLQQEIATYQKIAGAPVVTVLTDHLPTIAAGGKRIRPFLLWQVAQRGKRAYTFEELSPLLLATELFHIFCLIHDDVMDEAMVRHGVPTMQTQARVQLYGEISELRGQNLANSQAVLVGDIVFNSVFKLLNRFVSVNFERHQVVLDIFHTLVDEVCVGQMIDIDLMAQRSALKEQVIEKNRLKTAYYSFVRPLHLGALVGERPDLVDFIHEFGQQVGLLYQIQDDLLDLVGNTEGTKKPKFQDIEQGQHTLLSVYLRAQGATYAALLDDYVGRPLREVDHRALTKLLTDTGTIAYGMQLVEEHEQRAYELIETYNLDSADAEVFKAILTVVIKRTR